jgi:protein tyrosine/serine phosphatase
LARSKIVKKKSPLRTIITIAIIAGAIVLLVNNFKIPDLNCISPGVLYTSAQPRGMDYTRLLYKYHISTIVNLRSPTEHREQNWYSEEMTWVHSNGVKYVEMPLDRNVDNPAHFPDANMQNQFLAIMADKENLPVLIHDGKGESRVAMLAAVWLAKSQRYSAEQILAETVKIKGSPLVESEKTFISSLTK